MITACNALSIRLRRSRSAGKNDRDRSFGDLRLHIARGCGDGCGSVPGALGATSFGALVAAGADLLGCFRPGSMPVGRHGSTRQHRCRICTGECVELGEQGKMVLGHRVDRFLRVTVRGTH